MIEELRSWCIKRKEIMKKDFVNLKKKKSFRYLSIGTFKQHWAGHLLIKTNFHSFYNWLLIHVPEELISKTVCLYLHLFQTPFQV